MHFLKCILLKDRLHWGLRVINSQLTTINGVILIDAEGSKEDQEVILVILLLCLVGGIQNAPAMPVVSVAALVIHQMVE